MAVVWFDKFLSLCSWQRHWRAPTGRKPSWGGGRWPSWPPRKPPSPSTKTYKSSEPQSEVFWTTDTNRYQTERPFLCWWSISIGDDWLQIFKCRVIKRAGKQLLDNNYWWSQQSKLLVLVWLTSPGSSCLHARSSSWLVANDNWSSGGGITIIGQATNQWLSLLIGQSISGVHHSLLYCTN